MSREEAQVLLESMTKSVSLLRHMRTIELVMETYADKLGQNKEQWAIAGLLHDADYEAFPEKHPQIIVDRLRALGETEIAHAISAHYTKWNVPYETALDKALLACDELTGFIVACAQVRPDGIAGLEAKSVIKKLKDKGFAAKVERDEVYKGVELFGVQLADHITFIIDVLRKNKLELQI
ncbi:MAG: HD domain-containing protein [Cytophagales bacterium]|nr:HD domain-containing protein [Cytophagales bacterium]MCA6369678.1 HD domain-containing protein [Cytophagales bacterium]MCA6372445.1 HD domain-containing protein [Cytophagales bacterium]MCA6378020.1 HD domain-containing protein [Cytophagales bacterium]MCA6386079.1 HD domain-containing protein [Cytophagales bacterium]